MRRVSESTYRLLINFPRSREHDVPDERGPDVTARPYVLLSAAMSLDGYLDDTSDQRLLLSNDADFDRVDEVRAGADAILLGAGTVRTDDPRVWVRSDERRAKRAADGRRESPIKVTLTSGGELDPGARFFTVGTVDKVVYTTTTAARRVRDRLGSVATVVDGGTDITAPWMLEDLATRGVQRLMVEGGGTIHTMLLTAGVVDELHLVVAPFFVGDPAAPRFVEPGTFPQNPTHHMTLAESRPIGDCVLLRYLVAA